MHFNSAFPLAPGFWCSELSHLSEGCSDGPPFAPGPNPINFLSCTAALCLPYPKSPSPPELTKDSRVRSSKVKLFSLLQPEQDPEQKLLGREQGKSTCGDYKHEPWALLLEEPTAVFPYVVVFLCWDLGFFFCSFPHCWCLNM